MTITTGAPLAQVSPTALAWGFLTGGVIGTSLAAFVVGLVIDRTPLIVTGVALAAAYALLVFLAGRPRRAREAAVAPSTALAVIESREAFKDVESDVPVRFVLTVAPDAARAYRVEVSQAINVAELPDHRPGGVLVVEYPPDRPWQVRIVKRPTPHWEERAAGARIDRASGPVLLSAPPNGSGGGFLTLLGVLLGAAAVVLLFRADLFDQDSTARRPAQQPSVSITSSTSTVTSASGTVTLGPGRSMLDDGELRRAVGSLTEDGDRGTDRGTERGGAALTIVVEERTLSVVFVPSDSRAPGFDPDSLPYDRVPALVREARTTLGVDSPRSWRLTAKGATGSLTLRVAVTGPGGSAWLEADGRGEVVRRGPAR
ncbi:DUF3592 domain-containing protein [Streptomyces sp. NPDC091377]|uniref:DUF3592 domain-containing protein n=1 Tax=Streptomyces sp. NPDC091377 TaxID=3365995 RepID=UPI003826E363